MRDAIVALQLGPDEQRLNDLEWVDASKTLRLYVHGNTNGLKKNLTKSLPSTQAFEIIPAVNAKADLVRIIEGLADKGGAMPDGEQLAFARAASDGSSITVGLKSDANARVAPKPDAEIEGVKITFEAADSPIPVTRVRTSAPVFTGGRMAGQGYYCTTGFPVIRSDGEYGNVTADHCGRALEEPWYWGSSGNTVKVGTTSGQAGGGSDFEVFRGTTDPSGYSLMGAYNVSNQVVSIRGYYSAITGDQICYNGSSSGTVCGNTVQSTSEYRCYDTFQCYWLARSTNDAGTPAAGQGDSGGPVMSFALASNGSLGGYGTGIISGIVNATTTCTGDQDRLCSPEILYAPLATFVNNNLYYSLLVGPQL